MLHVRLEGEPVNPCSVFPEVPLNATGPCSTVWFLVLFHLENRSGAMAFSYFMRPFACDVGNSTRTFPVAAKSAARKINTSSEAVRSCP